MREELADNPPSSTARQEWPRQEVLYDETAQAQTEAALDLFIRYPRERGGFDKTRGMAHIALSGRRQTLCLKNCRPDAPDDGSISARGWRLLRGQRLREVTCASCLAALDRASVRAPATPEGSLHWQSRAGRMGLVLAQLEVASSLYEAHRLLAQVCSADLSDQELTTYRQYGLFAPQQCWRLLGVLRDQGFDVPPQALGLEEEDARRLQEARGSTDAEGRAAAAATGGLPGD